MLEAVEREIHELHAFFTSWYRGTADDSDAAFSRLKDVLAPEFILITSDGELMPGEQLLDIMRRQHGSRPEIEMDVGDIRLRLVSGELVLITYQEHGVTSTLRRSTLISAVLRVSSEQPNGLEWVHIHEVRLPGSN